LHEIGLKKKNAPRRYSLMNWLIPFLRKI